MGSKEGEQYKTQAGIMMTYEQGSILTWSKTPL